MIGETLLLWLNHTGVGWKQKVNFATIISMTFNSHIQLLAIGVMNASGNEKVEPLNINRYKEH